jgi:hypothetical protein
MKKSFLYVVPAALILALLFAGCPQDSDDDDDSGGGKPVNTPGSDLSYIAYAFGYGVDTVQVVNDIYMESYELVIPAGKTLDFRTNGKKLVGITDESKIIGQGTLILANDQPILDFAATPGAKIIADSDFINKYVVVDYTVGGPAPTGKWTPADWTRAGIANLPSAEDTDRSVRIRATWKQIVLIDSFENFKTYGEEGQEQGYVFIDGNSNQPRYVAINAPQEEIGFEEVGVINEKAGGLRFYLVGEPVKFNFDGRYYTLDLDKNPYNSAYYKTWEPEPGTTTPPETPTEGASVFYTGGNSNGASLTIAGNFYISQGKIKASGGLTVWGVVDNRGVTGDSTDITDGATPFTAWTAFLYAPKFGDSVKLPGLIASTFGGQAEFGGNLEIAGPVTFQKGTFTGEARFRGPVEFISEDPNDAIVFSKSVLFADDAKLYDNVTFSDEPNYYFKNISGLKSYDQIMSKFTSGSADSSFTLSVPTVEQPASGSFSANVVIPGENVTVAGSTAFEKNATFEGNVTFEGRPRFGTAAAAKDLGGSKTTTVIKGLAVFNNGADFGGTIAEDRTILGNTVIIAEAEFTGGSITNIADLQLGDSASPAVKFAVGSHETESYASGSGAIIIPPNGGITFKDNTLTFTGDGGTLNTALTFNNTAVKLDSKDSKMTFMQGPYAVEVMTAAAGTGGDGFEIKGNAILDAGQIIGNGSGVEVKAIGEITLTVPPPVSVSPETNPNSGRIRVDHALVDLSSGGAIVFAGTASRIVLINEANIKVGVDGDGNPILAIPNGQANSKSATIIAGSVASGSGVALLTGTAGTGAALFRIGTLAGQEYPYPAGTEISVVAGTWSNALNRNNRFVWVGTSSLAGSEAVAASAISATDIAVFEKENDINKN